jgi:hypothetical protein
LFIENLCFNGDFYAQNLLKIEGTGSSTYFKISNAIFSEALNDAILVDNPMYGSYIEHTKILFNDGVGINYAAATGNFNANYYDGVQFKYNGTGVKQAGNVTGAHSFQFSHCDFSNLTNDINIQHARLVDINQCEFEVLNMSNDEVLDHTNFPGARGMTTAFTMNHNIILGDTSNSGVVNAASVRGSRFDGKNSLHTSYTEFWVMADDLERFNVYDNYIVNYGDGNEGVDKTPAGKTGLPNRAGVWMNNSLGSKYVDLDDNAPKWGVLHRAGAPGGASTPYLNTPTMLNNTTFLAGSTGGMVLKAAEATAAMTASASVEITVNVPNESIYHGAQIRVDDAVSHDWDAYWVDDNNHAEPHAAPTIICTNKSSAKNTKCDRFMNESIAAQIDLVASATGYGQVVIQRTSDPGVDAFTATGTMRAIVYYWDFASMADAP